MVKMGGDAKGGDRMSRWQIEEKKQIQEECVGIFCLFEPEWITNSPRVSYERHECGCPTKKITLAERHMTTDGKVRQNIEMKVSGGARGSIKREGPEEERSEGRIEVTGCCWNGKTLEDR